MGKKTKNTVFAILGLLTGFAVFLPIRFTMLAKESQQMPAKSSFQEGGLAACDDESHCFETKMLSQEMLDRLKTADAKKLEEIRTYLEKNGFEKLFVSKDYLHFTHKSELFGFVDDLEFAHSEGGITVRSASRVGKSDLGANKERVLKILNEVF